jgi:hypothetical protein
MGLLHWKLIFVNVCCAVIPNKGIIVNDFESLNFFPFVYLIHFEKVDNWDLQIDFANEMELLDPHNF